MFLGEDLPVWLLLAFGGALAAGTAMALVRPRINPETGDPVPRPPLLRSLVMIVVGSIAAIWAIASLISG